MSSLSMLKSGEATEKTRFGMGAFIKERQETERNTTSNARESGKRFMVHGIAHSGNKEGYQDEGGLMTDEVEA